MKLLQLWFTSISGWAWCSSNMQSENKRTTQQTILNAYTYSKQFKFIINRVIETVGFTVSDSQFQIHILIQIRK